jgi:hypothetical protein
MSNTRAYSLILNLAALAIIGATALVVYLVLFARV